MCSVCSKNGMEGAGLRISREAAEMLVCGVCEAVSISLTGRSFGESGSKRKVLKRQVRRMKSLKNEITEELK